MSTTKQQPSVDDADIAWISERLGMRSLDGARRSFLQAQESVDVSACPGSGKTTLVVAKLAALARKWPLGTQGICVLSHTNVAREEIQRRLGQTEVGDKLVRYPHYIDTIHGFINRFLAIPWLTSNGHKVTLIDDDSTQRRRRRALGRGRWGVEAFLEKRHIELDSLQLTSCDLTTPLANWGVTLGSTSQTFMNLTSALRTVAEEGYFKFNEMLLFGEELLKDSPDAAAALRHRFPFVLIDEMQDTSSRQIKILDAIFTHDSPGTAVQRVGDINQAIFTDDATGAEEEFPHPSRARIRISDSFRFDDSIATLISNLATDPDEDSMGMRGIGASSPDLARDRHTIFVFPKNDTSGVLPAYAETVRRFLKPEHYANLRVAAVGAVHKDKLEVLPSDKKFPNTVSHYWGGYSPRAGGKTYHPETLVECLRASQAQARSMASSLSAGTTEAPEGTISSAVNSVAAAMIRFLNSYGRTQVLSVGSRPHRSLERRLLNNSRALSIYRNFVKRFVLDGAEHTEEAWRSLVPDLLEFAHECLPAEEVSAEQPFLKWVAAQERPVASDATPANSLVVEGNLGDVQIDVSSIHAIKGETHAATLLLDTFEHAHLFKSLMPWLAGDRMDAEGCNPLQLKRLRSAYVAMSRPAHLLCIAIADSSLGDGANRKKNIVKLQARGWRIEELGTAPDL